MTLLVGMLLAGALLIILVLARKNAPSSREEWDEMLDENARRCLDTLELNVLADGAMASDALSRAMEAKKSLAFGEALRLIDISCGVLEAASKDRVHRLRGMALHVRMASAIMPIGALQPKGIRLGEVRTLVTAARFLHHLLMTATERVLLRLTVLRFAYQLTRRAMCRGAASIHEDPTKDGPWTRCDAAVKDCTVTLDPAMLDSFRALLARSNGHQQA